MKKPFLQIVRVVGMRMIVLVLSSSLTKSSSFSLSFSSLQWLGWWYTTTDNPKPGAFVGIEPIGFIDPCRITIEPQCCEGISLPQTELVGRVRIGRIQVEWIIVGDKIQCQRFGTRRIVQSGRIGGNGPYIVTECLIPRSCRWCRCHGTGRWSGRRCRCDGRHGWYRRGDGSHGNGC